MITYIFRAENINENGEFIGTFPDGVTSVFLLDQVNIKTLTNLPASLEELDLIACKSLESLDLSGATGLKNIDLEDSTIKTLTNLPASLEELYLVACKSLESLDLSGATGLKKIDLAVSAITKLTNLPTSLEELELRDCESLESLDLSGATGLKKIDLCASAIKTLANLPASLEKLELRACESLESLDLSGATGLKKINLSGCTNLPNTPAFIAQLEALEKANESNADFQLVWPKHLDRTGGGVNKIMNSLKDAYKEYYKTDDNLKNKTPPLTDEANYPVLKLFHRFLSETVAVRGGIGSICESALPVVRHIEANPKILEFINESAKGYLDACVNQPVAGFTEIACLVNIHKQNAIPEKLEAVRIFKAMESIREAITTIKNDSGLTVGQGVEAELANAMLSEVNKELMKNEVITEPWPGVPNGIAYQGTIQSFLTQENIAICSKKSIEILKQPLKDIASYVCEGSLQDFWASMVLSEEEISEIKEPVKNAQLNFLNLEDQEDSLGREEYQNQLSIVSKNLENAESTARKNLLTRSKEGTMKLVGVESVSTPPSASPKSNGVENVAPRLEGKQHL